MPGPRSIPPSSKSVKSWASSRNKLSKGDHPPSWTRRRKLCSTASSESLARPNSRASRSRSLTRSAPRSPDCTPFSRSARNWPRRARRQAKRVVTMDKRFWVVAYPGLPKDTVNAIDPRICLCGTGTGTVGVREAGLEDLGVPLLNREVSPLPDTPRPGRFLRGHRL